MTIQKKLLTILLAVFIFSGCAVSFVGKTPINSSAVRFITGNETIAKNDYDVKGIVVAQRNSYYFDLFGLIKPVNKALSEVLTDDISQELTMKVIELGGNAVMDMEVVTFTFLPGGFLYLIPIGIATVTMQATAIHIK